MGLFKKNLTPQERFDKADKAADRALKKRDKLDKRKRNDPFYEEERKELTRQLAKALEQKNIAKLQMKHPAHVPKYQDNSKHTNIEVNYNSKNKKQTEISPRLHVTNKKNKK